MEESAILKSILSPHPRRSRMKKPLDGPTLLLLAVLLAMSIHRTRLKRRQRIAMVDVAPGESVFKGLQQRSQSHLCPGTTCPALSSWKDYWQSLPLVRDGVVEEFDERRAVLHSGGQSSVFTAESPSAELQLLALDSAPQPLEISHHPITIKSIVIMEGKEYPELLEAFVQQHVLPSSPYLLPTLGVYKQLRSKIGPPCIHVLLPAMRIDLRAATVAALRGRLFIDFRLLLAEMVLAVEALHKAGYLHRDIKPHNFLVSPQGHVLLADFDGVWPVGLPVTTAEDLQGTTNYLSPELGEAFQRFVSSESELPWDMSSALLKGDSPRPTLDAFTTQSDIWSLGVTAKEISSQLQRLGPLQNAAALEDLLSRMMRPLETRATIQDIKEHPYFTSEKTFQILGEDSVVTPVHFLSALRRSRAIIANPQNILR